MSAKERRRAVIMAGVQTGELNLTGAAAVLGLSYRQTKRVWRRYRAAGDAGLVHRLRGRPGPRRKAPGLRAQVLARVAARDADFRPTLAVEYLAQEGWRVDPETLRRWLLAAGRWTVRKAMQRRTGGVRRVASSGRPPLRSGLPASPPTHREQQQRKGTLSPEFLRGHF